MPNYNKESPDYKADQHASKQNIKDLTLATPGVVDAYNADRANRLENNWTAKSLFSSTISFK